MTFTHAIVRPPGPGFERGLTTAGLGPPDLELALRQHARYCEALERCGLALCRLPADPDHPDGTFVEDPIVVTPGAAVLARPGAPSRRGEVPALAAAIAPFRDRILTIAPPAVLDGGDVCLAGGLALVGLSERTDEAGARQLAGFLAQEGLSTVTVDLRGLGLLHLKSGLGWLGDGRLAVVEELIEPLGRALGAGLKGGPPLPRLEPVRVPPAETYAANCLRVNGRVLMAAGYPGLAGKLRGAGHDVLEVDVSEFRKMDGGVSCLSVRFRA